MSLLGVFGEREVSQDVRNNNSTAVTAIANIVKSSLGPQGLDKMIVDDIGDVTITNDGATILKLLEVEHPAAKILVELANIQDKEVGDGTTSVVLLAADLLKKKLIYKSENIFDKEMLLKVAKTSMSSKLIGPESDFFSNLIIEALGNIRISDKESWQKFNPNAIHILKNHGQSIFESKLINGFAVMKMRSSQGMPLIINKARIACLDLSLTKFRLPMGTQVLINNPENLEKIRQEEMNITKLRCQKLLNAGANVIVCTKGIDEFALKYFVEAKVIAIRRVTKQELRKIAKSTNATVITTLSDEFGDEKIDPSYFGEADSVSEERIGDNEYILFKRTKNSLAQSIILRGANEFMLEEIQRSLNDALHAVKRVLETQTVVVGGGCVETAVGIYLEDFSRSIGSREQLAIQEFAEALYSIPKTLAINAAKDALDLLAKLRTFHYASQNSDNQERIQWKNVGLDLLKGTVRNNYTAGVFEPAISKVKSLKFATEAAITILRIDDLIKLAPKQEKQN